jgi:deazaflavin-dependent oxidoreductase (nitroreductase family)
MGSVSSWNDRVIDEFRTNHGVTERWGKTLIVMHTTGAKSGEERLAPVMGLRLDDGAGWLIVASKGGAPENPAWYYNLLAHPEFDAEMHVDGDVATVRVTARELTGDEHDEAWQRIIARRPYFADYQANTPRTLPIFKLERA